MNNNEVEYMHRADFGTFVKLVEYSPDYTSSITSASGFVKDVAVTPADEKDSGYKPCG